MNMAVLNGRLGEAPSLKYTPNGNAVARWSMATTRAYYTGEGDNRQLVESVTWHNCKAWGKLAETCAKRLSKGQMVFVKGEIENSEWVDKEGIKRWSTEIVADVVEFGAKPKPKPESDHA